MSLLSERLRELDGIEDTASRLDQAAEERVTAASLIRGDSITPEPINWLWPGWLAGGKMHILGGQAGGGKTTIALALAATLTGGGRWPDGSKAPVGSVVIWSGEDDPKDTLVPRLIAMGADRRRIHFVSGMIEGGKPRPFDPASDMPALQEGIESLGDVRLLVIDPIVSAIAGDSHKNAETRRGLQPLVDLAQTLGCALLGITHFSKGTQGREPIDRITGSLAFAALARIVLVCAKEQQTEQDRPPRRLFLRAKSNIGLDDGGFAYDLHHNELHDYPGVQASSVLWGKAVQGCARDILADAETPREDGGALAEAQDWLRDFLAEGPQTQREVMAAAEAHCHARATVTRAKKALGVMSQKMGGENGRAGAHWFWCLPGTQDAQNSQDTQHPGLSPLGRDDHLGPDINEEAQ